MNSKHSAFLAMRLVNYSRIFSRRPLQTYVHRTTVCAATYQQKRNHMHQAFTKKTVLDRIMLVLNLFDKVDNEKLTPDSDFFKDLGLDSLDFVEVIINIENEFCFEIPDGDSDRMRTPRDIYQYICDKCDVFE